MPSRRNFLGVTAGPTTVGVVSGVGTVRPSGRQGAAGAALIAPLTHGESANPDLDPTGATGFLTFSLNADGTLDYRITAKSVENVTQAHIHGEAPRGETAGVVAFLLAFSDTPAGPPDQAEDGPVSESRTITDDDFLDSTTVDDILTETDPYYVNPHTVQNAAGEIRGQIRTTDGD